MSESITLYGIHISTTVVTRSQNIEVMIALTHATPTLKKIVPHKIPIYNFHYLVMMPGFDAQAYLSHCGLTKVYC